MNRIYQGRVSNAYPIAENGEPISPQPENWNGETALWEHHALFQDAVNYYAFALAVMAEGMTHKDDDGKDVLTPMAKFAEQLRGNDKTGVNRIEGRWEKFTHKATEREGLRRSLSRTLGIPLAETTWEKCGEQIFEAVLKKFPGRRDADGNDVLHGVIAELFPEKSRGAPKNLANEDPSWLCWAGKREKDNTPFAATYRKQRGIYDFMGVLFQADADDLINIAARSVEKSYLSGVVVSVGDEEVNSTEGNDSGHEETHTENPDEVAGYFVGAAAIAELERCIECARRIMSKVELRAEMSDAEKKQEAAKAAFQRDYKLLGGDLSKADEQFRTLAEIVESKRHEELETPNSFQFQDWKRQGPGKDNLRVELFVLLHCSGGSEFAARLLKARLKGLYLAHLHSTDKRRYIQFVDPFSLVGASADGKEPEEKVAKARKAAAKQKDVSTKSAVASKDYIKTLRKEIGYIFPSFTAIRGFFAGEGSSEVCKLGEMGWTRFNNSAYEEAIKSPHQIREKQKERDNERKKLEVLEKLYKGKGRHKGKDDDGEDEEHIPGGFSDDGDPRFPAMQRVREALRVEDGVQPGDFYEYTISLAALRGYEELREAWNKKVEAGEEYSKPKHDELLKILKDHQKEHREDVGAVRLFEEFLKKDNWCVWQVAQDDVEKERAANNYSDNFVRDYLRFVEVVDERKRKEKPIQYTPADASESRRLFDFKGGTEGGWFEHESSADGLSLMTQIAVKCTDAGKTLYRQQAVRIHYTAPRLLRDEARVLAEGEKLESANWAQPMMRALGIPADSRHDFEEHAVSLMPDWNGGSGSPSPDRMLLNFVLAPKEDKFIEHLRKQMGRKKWPWTMQFNWSGDQRDSTLRWPHEDWMKVKTKKDFPGQWFNDPSLKSFRLLSVDLGQKQAGAYAVVEVSCVFPEKDKAKARFIGTTGEGAGRRDWYAKVVTTGLHKLPGEDAVVYRPEYVDKKPAPGSKAFREELSGSAGRIATEEESQKALTFIAALEQTELLDEDMRDATALRSRLTFPLQNAKMLIALRRAQSFASRLHRWFWFLDPQDEKDRKDQAARRRTAIKEIAESDKHPWLDEKAHERAREIHAEIAAANEKGETLDVPADARITVPLRERLEKIAGTLPACLETIANRVYASRKGCFVWKEHPDKPDCRLLDFVEFTKEEKKERYACSKEETRLAGQRGLSMERIEQLEELRKRCQSLNQMLRRSIGGKPPISRDDSIPDPCPKILAKLEEIKEQRRNQTAHMILAEALGLKLAAPGERDEAERKERAVKDAHGEYVKVDDKGLALPPDKHDAWRGVVDFIVVEDLSRYRTTLGRAPRENSRLMKWCHRAIRDKLKQMCEPFGLPLIETPAAYSSRFCSRTGVAGFRAVELSAASLTESKWTWKTRKPDEEGRETDEQKKRREQWEDVFAQVRKANESRDGKSKGKEFRTLLVPDAGGSIFIPMAALDEKYKRPENDESQPKKHRPIIQYGLVTLEENQSKQPRLIHADINAAVNLALRAVADPRVWSIHSRLRSERKFGSPPKPKTKKAKAKKNAPPPEKPPEEVKPDQFFVSEKEKRKFGVLTNPKAESAATEAKKEAAESGKKNDQWIEIELRDAKQAALNASDSRHPNFFADFAQLRGAHRGAADLAGLPKGQPVPVHLVSGKALWGYIKGQTWNRCLVINIKRLQAWGIEPPAAWLSPEEQENEP